MIVSSIGSCFSMSKEAHCKFAGPFSFHCGTFHHCSPIDSQSMGILGSATLPLVFQYIIIGSMVMCSWSCFLMFFTNFCPAIWQLHGLPGICHILLSVWFFSTFSLVAMSISMFSHASFGSTVVIPMSWCPSMCISLLVMGRDFLSFWIAESKL